MWIEELALKNFRNYSDLRLNFSPGINGILGKNGSGKTSLVESIGFLALSKSFRSSDEKETIRFGADFARIEAKLHRDVARTYRIVLTPQGKKIEIDGAGIAKLSEMSGICKIISFLPKDVELFRDSPAVRRKFVDLNLSMLDPVYLKLLGEYGRFLTELRNLAKQENPDLVVAEVLSGQLAERGFDLQKRRIGFIDKLNEELCDVLSELDGGEMKLCYHPSVNECEKERYIESVAKEVARSLACRKGKISIPGIHLDDLEAVYCGRDLGIYGSQGQNRLAVIALKLALVGLIEKKFHEKPIVILDDVLSEFDSEHRSKLMKMLGRMEQVFITGTEIDFDEKTELYTVEENQVRRNC